MTPSFLKLAALLAVGVAAFAVPDPRLVLGLAIGELGLWAMLRLPLRDLGRMAKRLAPLGTILFLTALVSAPPSVPSLRASLTVAGLMTLRVAVVVLASALVRRTGDPNDLARALGRLGLPRTLAMALELSLAGFDAPARSGTGGGNGRGGGRQVERNLLAEWRSGRADSLLRLLRGRFSEAERMTALRLGDAPDSMRHDVTSIVALTLTGLSIKAFKFLPGIPFAPGHKGVIVIPLYILAATLTRGRWGATTFGATFGILSFLMGDGQLGPLDIARHLAPGLVIDLLLPLVRRPFPNPHPLVYSGLGVAAAGSRLAAFVLIGLLLRAPASYYALLTPLALFHVGFGAASGLVSCYLLQYMVPNQGVATLEKENSDV